jgi:chromosome segregation ATPase
LSGRQPDGMHHPEDQLKRIQQKLQRIIREFTGLQKEKKQLEQELEKLKEQLRHQSLTIETLRQQADILKMNAGELNEADKKEIEKRLNAYIREIDRCIALLSE